VIGILFLGDVRCNLTLYQGGRISILEKLEGWGFTFGRMGVIKHTNKTNNRYKETN
jgi:hypothetical protein